MKDTKKISINKEQSLYVIPYENSCETGFSCLGFDVCKDRSERLAKELHEPIKAYPVGSMEAIKEYNRLVEVVRDRNKRTGFRSNTGLVPQLIGYEGWKVKVINRFGEKKSFIVGKSLGWIPCHIGLKTINSRDGDDLITDSPFKSFTPVSRIRSYLVG